MNNRIQKIIDNLVYRYGTINAAVYDHDDLRQEVLMCLWKSFGSEVDNVPNYIIYKASKWTIFDYIRKNDMRTRGHIKNGFRRAIFTEFCDQSHIQDNNIDLIDKIYVKKLISFLNEKQRYVILSYYFNGFLISDISDVMGITHSGVSQNHRKALRKLKAKAVKFNQNSS